MRGKKNNEEPMGDSEEELEKQEVKQRNTNRILECRGGRSRETPWVVWISSLRPRNR
jgi:hypothetical protein